MRQFAFLCVFAISMACTKTDSNSKATNGGTEMLAQASSTQTPNTTVNYVNNSGIDLVVVFSQAATAGQDVTQSAWLKSSTTGNSWEVPKNPTSNKDLAPYMFDLKKGDSLAIEIPAYTAATGFRAIIADTMYKHDALQYIYPSAKDSTAYMAIPNLLTATYPFDKIEAGLTINFPGIWNITAVDFFGIPMQLASGTQLVGYKDGVTAEGLKDSLAALDSPYSAGGTMSPNTSTNVYRFFSPSHISSMGSALNKQIYNGLTALPNFTDTVFYGNYSFFSFTTSVKTKTDTVGTVTCNYLNQATGVNSPISITVNDVTSVNAFAGEINGVQSGSQLAAQKELGAILSAAICRGVTGDPNKWGDIVHVATNCPTPWNYYPDGVQSNLYSKTIHSYSIKEKNYGFPYDDFFADEAGFTVLPGDDVTITVLPYTGTMTAKPSLPTKKKTGCLVATVPASSIYPSGSGWDIGSMEVDSIPIIAGANQLCLLSSDFVTCTFPDYAQYELKIDMKSTSNTGALTFYKNGKVDSGLSISGMVYNAKTRVLTFGQAASWVQN